MGFYFDTKREEDCCGCGACVQVCPVNCLSMVTNAEGFLYPVMDSERCIHCHKCNLVCPFKGENPFEQAEEPLSAYAAYARDHQVLAKSSSGGIFSCIASDILEQGGRVYGAAFDSTHRLCHCGIEQRETLDLLRGSKYIQSNTKETFREVKELLKNGQPVFYVGTPCQIAGLRLFLGGGKKHLVTADVICHGVPSQLMFDKYVESLETKHKGQLTQVIFRDKTKFGWSITLRYDITNPKGVRTFIVPSTFSAYFSGFLRGYILRESCYCCPYASLKRPGDITMADYWGYQREVAEINSVDGLSLILINSVKGQAMVERLGDSIWKKQLTIKQACVKENINLFRPTFRPEERTQVYRDLHQRGFGYITKKYLRPPQYHLKFVKSKIPKRIRETAKKLLRVGYV